MLEAAEIPSLWRSLTPVWTRRNEMAEMSYPASKRDGVEACLAEAKAPMLRDVVYSGRRQADGGCNVWCEEKGVASVGELPTGGSAGRPLPLCLNIRNHSPSGFEWGYGGSGPAQLALALLVDALGDVDLAQKHYQDFKFEVVAGWGRSWTITAEEIREFVAARCGS
jgi:hypothetical protein